jgi:4-hydroxy-2-oxoheptanedioate aldolase
LAASAAVVTLPLLQAAAGAMQSANAPATSPSTAPAARAAAGAGTGRAGSVTFNTVLTKLKAGKQVFSNTIDSPDLDAAKKACEGQDFIWIEMQHSLLTWRETSDLIKTVAEAGCIPFVRVPSPTEGEIQKATDGGALGIIVPMVYSIQRARDAVMFAKYPVGNLDNPNTRPWGHRSVGGNQARRLWPHYAENANNNIMIVIQIENPAGVGLIDNILDEVEGIDVVMVASNDFGQQAGDRDGSPTYNAREEIVRKSVLAHGKYLAGPSSWQNRPGYTFFQGRRSATNTGYEAR